ncbi:uncharacterized protein BJ212DRAFT_1294948 [Suillus subaureus]|uniref:Uncharacterized protein n=1 Tax=Suillus subaureus TaxID=48587 RepID=A0A9P7EMQ7_9AGAM|nr:uncharacterized protein BJ212DRAFT_1294948 [Suillus subaureus]KAG1825529.1 hypothetical protein BJ212DRAFT_1294948 [Suillus subaureus]
MDGFSEKLDVHHGNGQSGWGSYDAKQAFGTKISGGITSAFLDMENPEFWVPEWMLEMDYRGTGRRTEDGGRRTEDGGRRTEDGGRRTEDGGRRTEDGGRRTEDGGRRTEDGGRRTEDGGRRTEDGGRRTEDGGRRTEDGGRRTEDGGRRTEDGGRRTEDGGRRTEDGGRRTEDGGRRTEDGGRRTEDGGRRTEDGGRRTDGGQTEDRQRTDRGQTEDRRRTDGGQTEDRWRTDGGWMENVAEWKMSILDLEGILENILVMKYWIGHGAEVVSAAMKKTSGDDKELFRGINESIHQGSFWRSRVTSFRGIGLNRSQDLLLHSGKDEGWKMKDDRWMENVVQLWREDWYFRGAGRRPGKDQQDSGDSDEQRVFQVLLLESSALDRRKGFWSGSRHRVEIGVQIRNAYGVDMEVEDWKWRWCKWGRSRGWDPMELLPEENKTRTLGRKPS